MSDDKPVVFLGPSLATKEARRLLEADYRLPVQRGDLDAMRDGATVGIIDGILESHLRIGLGEVRRALDRGITLLGAASTGALLAVSLKDPRMTGVGRVYDFIIEHPEVGEDLVSVICAEPNRAPLTFPLINAVLSIIDYMKEQDDSFLDVDAVIRSLQSLPLVKRSLQTILDQLGASSHITASQLSTLTMRNYKADDARLLLERLANSFRQRSGALS